MMVFVGDEQFEWNLGGEFTVHIKYTVGSLLPQTSLFAPVMVTLWAPG